MTLCQRAKKVVSDSPGLVDFAIGLVNSVLNLPVGQVEYFEEFNLQKNCQIKKCWGLFEMTFGQVIASFSLPEWQAVKMTFFAPCHEVPVLELLIPNIIIHMSYTRKNSLVKDKYVCILHTLQLLSYRW